MHLANYLCRGHKRTTPLPLGEIPLAHKLLYCAANRDPSHAVHLRKLKFRWNLRVNGICPLFDIALKQIEHLLIQRGGRAPIQMRIHKNSPFKAFAISTTPFYRTRKNEVKHIGALHV